jgi:hypothetical protein
MQTKWFEPASWSAQEAPTTPTDSASEQPNATPAAEAQLRTPVSEYSASHGSGSPAELLSFEEIYRSAGIKGVRMGYSISKVVEMLQSGHIRNLPTEIKRGALLMALEAAGIPVGEVLQDATLRQSALNSYEAMQRKQREEYEARKDHDNCAIRAEMDRVAAQYLARIKANLDEVASEKDAFREWQTKKEHQAQRIAEAVTLCAAQDGSAAQNDSGHVLREPGRAGKPGFVAR